MASIPVRAFSTGQLLGTATLTVQDRNIDVVASIGSTNFSLPAGRWLVTANITSTPSTGRGLTASSSVDTTIASPGPVTLPATSNYRAHKDFEGGVGGQVFATISIQKWNGSSWDHYGGPDSSVVAVNYTAAPSARTQVRGGNVHMFGTGQGYARTVQLLDAMVDLGMEIVRTSAPWGFVEQGGKGVYDSTAQTLVDNFMAACAARNLKVLMLCGAAPGWAGSTAKTNITWSGNTYQFLSNYAGPTNWQNYVDHITYTINRYGSELYAIEPLNEPNANLATTAATVASWHQYARAGINASNRPNVKLVGGTTSWTDTAYLQGLFDAGMHTYCDAISIHPYPVKFSPNIGFSPRNPLPDETNWFHSIASVNDMAAFLAANNTNLPVWVTEFGFCSNQSSLSYGSETIQGDHLRYAFRQLARIQNVDVAIMHSLEDAGRSGDGVTPAAPTEWQNFGLLRTDHVSKKASYPTVKTTLAQLAAGTA